MKKTLVVIIIAILLAFIATRFLFVGSALTLIPWCITGLLIGYWSANKKTALFYGAIYGFILSFSFMFFGYNGSASIISRFPFFALLGLFGAVCGIVLGVLGSIVKKI